MATVRLDQVSKIYGRGPNGFAAVTGLTLEFPDGELVVLTGPSGCGKSTTLRMIAGLENCTSGDIYIGDRRVHERSPKSRDVAMVFANDALYPGLSVGDNLRLGLKLRKYATADINKRVTDAAALLGIGELLERKPRTLSAGERRRVGIARAAARQPRALLCDAQVPAVGAQAKREFREEIFNLRQRLQATIIYATGDVTDALAMADRVVVMSNGTLQQQGAPREVYRQPANSFVASFFSDPPMNLISGTLKRDRGAFVFAELNCGTIEIRFPESERLAMSTSVDQQVLLGLRPEDIEVVEIARGQEPPSSTCPVVIEMAEPGPGETLLRVQTGAHAIICRTRQMFDHRDVGRRARLKLDLANAHFFDPISTKRLA